MSHPELDPRDAEIARQEERYQGTLDIIQKDGEEIARLKQQLAAAESLIAEYKTSCGCPVCKRAESALTAEQALSEQMRAAWDKALFNFILRDGERVAMAMRLEDFRAIEAALALTPTDALRTRLLEVAEKFQHEQWEWVQATFPGESADGAWKHLKEELDELEQAPTDPEEHADCFLLLMCFASHHGVNLMQAARAKFDKCKARKWVKTEHGWRHDKASETRRALEEGK